MTENKTKSVTVRPATIERSISLFEEGDLGGIDLIHIFDSLDRRADMEELIRREGLKLKSEIKQSILGVITQQGTDGRSAFANCPNFKEAAVIVAELIEADDLVDVQVPKGGVEKNLRRLAKDGYLAHYFNTPTIEEIPPDTPTHIPFTRLSVSPKAVAYLVGYGLAREIDLMRLMLTARLERVMVEADESGLYSAPWGIHDEDMDVFEAGAGTYNTALLMQNNKTKQLEAVDLIDAIAWKKWEKAWPYLAEKRDTIEAIIEPLNLDDGTREMVLESYNKDLRPRSKQGPTEIRNKLANQLRGIYPEEGEAEQYVEEFILRMAWLQLRSTLDWQTGLRNAQQERAHQRNLDQNLSNKEAVSVLAHAVKHAAFALDEVLHANDMLKEEGLTKSERHDHFVSRFGEDFEDVHDKLERQLLQVQEVFTLTAQAAGLLGDDAEAEEAMAWANKMGLLTTF